MNQTCPLFLKIIAIKHRETTQISLQVPLRDRPSCTGSHHLQNCPWIPASYMSYDHHHEVWMLLICNKETGTERSNLPRVPD